jgi:hypothetical protein
MHRVREKDVLYLVKVKDHWWLLVHTKLLHHSKINILHLFKNDHSTFFIKNYKIIKDFFTLLKNKCEYVCLYFRTHRCKISYLNNLWESLQFYIILRYLIKLNFLLEKK